MYKIMKDDSLLVAVTALSWVRLQDNGSFVLCDGSTASGIVVDGTVYHVAGRPDIDGVETVTITQISEAAYQLEQIEQKAVQEAATLETQSAIAELSIIIAAATTTTTDTTETSAE